MDFFSGEGEHMSKNEIKIRSDFLDLYIKAQYEKDRASVEQCVAEWEAQGIEYYVCSRETSLKDTKRAFQPVRNSRRRYA